MKQSMRRFKRGKWNFVYANLYDGIAVVHSWGRVPIVHFAQLGTYLPCE